MNIDVWFMLPVAGFIVVLIWRMVIRNHQVRYIIDGDNYVETYILYKTAYNRYKELVEKHYGKNNIFFICLFNGLVVMKDEFWSPGWNQPD
jgi:hypothetical protein